MTRHCRSRLSQRALTSLQTGQWCSESLGYGRGSLQVRATPAGVLYYYRSGGERTRVPLGPGSGPRALSLDEARQKSLALSAHNQSAKTGDDSLGALLVCYAHRLEQRGAATAQATMALFRRHIERPHPDIWLRQARRIRPEHVVILLDPLVAKGKLPTARKLRSSLNSAFQVALQAPFCARSAEFRCFRVTDNPLTRIRQVDGGKALPDRVLSVDEMQALWEHVDRMRSARGSVLRFYLLTGAQRLEQLLRTTRDDLVEEGLILRDRKGRRQQPRLHLVPLIAPAWLALDEMTGRGPHVVSVDGGHTALHPSTLWRYVNGVAEELLDHGGVAARFSPADLRRTVETRLAAVKIRPVVRAHLQSHGLSGVQTRHYDRHTYLDEKRDALRRLFSLLTGG